MTPVTKPLVRRTECKVRGRMAVVTLTPNGLKMHRMGTSESYVVPLATLWRWLETANVRI